ncbi:MAG TPA: hypothetical protein VJ964_02255 [Balneolaceae bacterium]|nr:hypothetical protein [Balneolaceae bacterium]
MKRIHFLAAELYCYSYDNYEAHLGVNARFDRLMPETTALLERAEKEGWADERIAEESDLKPEDIPKWRKRFREALAIVDAESPAALFLEAVRDSVKFAVEEGLNDEKSINNLVGQICYRTADLSRVLRQNDEPLWKYSEELRSRADDIQDIDHKFNFDE